MQDVTAPEFAGIDGWLNAKPISIKKLRGSVVLIDFWTYTCINCVRTLPYVRKWHRKYSKKGLVVIGVHSPEFGFEKDQKNIRAALKKHGIRYPVALDNNMKTWEAYNNRFWPCKYIIDGKGRIRHVHAGEGAYAETELWITKLLSEMGKPVNSRIERTERASYNINTTLEIRCGRAQIGSDAEKHDIGKLYLGGQWVREKEFIESTGTDSITLAFRAKSMNIVMAPKDGAATAKILIDGKPLADNTGSDVRNSAVLIDRPDIYNIYNRKEFGMHELKITADKPVRIFSFTFG